MKKLLVIVAICNCVCLFAQRNRNSQVRVGLKLGYFVHTLSGDLTASYPAGHLLAGFWFQFKMNAKWTAQAEALLLDKGIGGGGAGKNAHWVNLHYLEVPLLFQYHRKNVYYEFGPGMGYLINYAERLHGGASPELLDNYPFSRSELSFNAGICCSLNEKWTLGLRLSHSLLPVRGAVPSVSKVSYNQLLALSVTRWLRRKKAKGPDEE